MSEGKKVSGDSGGAKPGRDAMEGDTSTAIVCHSPTRISFGGGGTDVEPFPQQYGGEVVNATLSIYMAAYVRLRDDRRVAFRSNSHPATVSYDDVGDIPLDGRFDFAKLSAKAVHGESRGYELFMYSGLPERSGLGGSGAMCVAVLAAFDRSLGRAALNNYELAELAFRIETEQLGNASGRQDQYAAAFGGMNHFEFLGGNHVRVNPIRLMPEAERILNQSLVLLWIGERSPSGEIIEDQTARVRGGGQVVEAMQASKPLVAELKEALEDTDIARLGALLDELWRLKKSFSPNVSNERIDTIYSQLKAAGMLGGKITGAGGGGHMLACCRIEHRDALLGAARAMGLVPVPFGFTHEGVLSQRVPLRLMPGHQVPAASA